MWSKNPGKTNAAIKQCLIDTAVKLGAGSFNNAWGNGRVDAEAALKCVDPIFVPVKTLLSPACAESVITVCNIISRLTDCRPSVIQACLPSELIACTPSRLVRCPPSRLPVLCQESRLPHLCTFPSRIGPSCEASWVDACPSALDPNCGFTVDSNLACRIDPLNPTVVINPVLTDIRGPAVGPAIGAFGRAGLGELRRGGAAGGPAYYWVDDGGTVHAWSAEQETSTEVWRDKVGQYFWVDDAGTVHPWPPASGGSGGTGGAGGSGG